MKLKEWMKAYEKYEFPEFEEWADAYEKSGEKILNSCVEIRNLCDAHQLVCEILDTKFDHIVSISMIPFFGNRRWKAYKKLNRVQGYLFARLQQIGESDI